MYLIKKSISRIYKKNFYNSTIKDKFPNLKMGKDKDELIRKEN